MSAVLQPAGGAGTVDPATAGEWLLEVEGLHVHFVTTRGVVRAVEGISYQVRAGEVVALVGESGCGKSVSSLAIMRLLAQPAGRIVAGRILFQGDSSYEIDNMEGLAVHKGAAGETILSLISDDNFNAFLQRTVFLQFTLIEEAPKNATRQ